MAQYLFAAQKGSIGIICFSFLLSNNNNNIKMEIAVHKNYF